MVFPQGVFSSASAEALKRNGYLAAANTETSPVDYLRRRDASKGRLGCRYLEIRRLPDFLRRYAKHSLENFAFDLLLGKPCLIVAHHELLQRRLYAANRID